jgi:hypothetical protein
MKVSFTFDGQVLKLRLDVEDEMERAIARLMESYCMADISVQREQYCGYGVESIKTVSIWLRKPSGSEPQNGDEG